MTPAEQKYRALSGTGLSGAGPVHGAIRRSRGVFTFVLVGGTFAILIWMKLRVVGSVPRTAYADPDDRPAPVQAPTHRLSNAQDEQPAQPQKATDAQSVNPESH
ncbi:MAG: hypothetical protein NTV94_08710 [Planctomycetota bacterium]|nr:hypothetical protein [Planctomycetota bacterium]